MNQRFRAEGLDGGYGSLKRKYSLLGLAFTNQQVMRTNTDQKVARGGGGDAVGCS